MSKFKNKKALALSVGAIMAGVSVIGVVAACAPTKAKPAKPTEKKVEQPQTSGTESKKQDNGSGSTTTGTKQGSQTGGSTNTNTETGSTTNTTKQGSENGGTTNSSGGTTNSNPQAGGETNGSQNGGTVDGSNGSTNGKQGDQGSNNVDPEAEKKKKEQEEQTAKQKEAEATLKAKKEQAITTINGLADLSTDESKGFTDRVNEITDTTKTDEIENIVKEAQVKDAENKKAKEAGKNNQDSTQSGSDGKTKEQDNKEMKPEGDATNQGSGKPEGQADKEKPAESSPQQGDQVEANKQDAKKLTLVSFTKKEDGYIYMYLKTSKEFYNELKSKQFYLEFDWNDGKITRVVEDASSTFKHPTNQNDIIYNRVTEDKNGFVTFEISTEQNKYYKEKGTYRLSKVSYNPNSENLLASVDQEFVVTVQ